VRVDSGCAGGQIYDDDSCDCADQFFDFISKYVANGEGIVLHVPCHDGRGFGFAPKAETEIYKQGGTGRIHTTKPIDTVSAAKLLYKADDYNYDIRDYKGVALILKELGCNDIKLYTDSRKKVNSLSDAGINVERIPTETHKSTCKQHIEAKKSNPLFFR
jgi:GTP cyclohydrolase II